MLTLPDYIAKTVPNPTTNRAPWYKNTAPSYAGTFLWVAFYQTIAVGTLNVGGLGIALISLVVAGLLSYALYYYVPGMLGMKTGYPLYVVGSSTFGTTGGYVMPGLLMGLLQVGWFAVASFYATQYILSGLKTDITPGTPTFWIVCVVWGYIMAWVGVRGIRYVARVSLFLNMIPFLMIVIMAAKNWEGVSHFRVAGSNPIAAFTTMLALVIGFFATGGAAGTDFGMNNRDARDVKMGGLVGIVLASVLAGGLPLIAIAGAHGLNPQLASYNYGDVIGATGGGLASAMFFLFAIASVAPACFCAFIAGNSFSTMIPRVPRLASSMVGVTIAIVLAATGVAANLARFFGLVGASFGPICGAMVADYLLSGREWAGPRSGINWAGYLAWGIGFVVGITPSVPAAVVCSFVVGLAVYTLAAKLGLEPKTVTCP
jgi:cytosine permease